MLHLPVCQQDQAPPQIRNTHNSSVKSCSMWMAIASGDRNIGHVVEHLKQHRGRYKECVLTTTQPTQPHSLKHQAFQLVAHGSGMLPKLFRRICQVMIVCTGLVATAAGC